MSSPENGTFNDGVARLIERIECRRLTSDEEKFSAYRLRYDAYLREGAIEPNPSRVIVDRFDDTPNNPTYGFFIDGRLAASVRLGFGTSDSCDVPAMATFPDVLGPIMAEPGRSLIDPTRFVLDEAHARLYPKLAYVTLRAAWLVSDHLTVDYTLASVRTEHQAFYRRFYGHTLLCEARAYPSLIKPLSLMLLPCRESRARGLARYPWLDSTRAEFLSLWPGPFTQATPSIAPAAMLDHSFAHAPMSLG
ncbi:hypothetical protein [Methylopila sp. M107]|uniref:N-acyl amino acid synthase FeeM domain-containing protein n=1 Tax=Methylopila sp. M107 TaxID=1101190 RepID=UPI0003691867|nr:hypothetical protein [Methylopila sp. M107]